MPIKIQCKNIIHYFRWDGKITIGELRQAMTEAHTCEPANRILHDLRKADISHFSNDEIKKLGVYIDELVNEARRGKYRSAIVVPNKLTYGLIRCAMGQSETAEHSTRIYYDIDFAIDWLVGLRK